MNKNTKYVTLRIDFCERFKGNNIYNGDKSIAEVTLLI